MMAMHRLRVEESSQVGVARRLAASMAAEAGFDEVRAGHAAIVVSELATNLVKHAGGGEILLSPLQNDGTTGIQTLSLDRGPGIGNIGECLRDGYSTTGSLGKGLGAVQRLSSRFDLYSKPGRGTAVLSRIWQAPPADAAPGRVESGTLCLSVPTEEVCGDATAMHQTPERVLILLADGLGHGPLAAEASAEAARIFRDHPTDTPADLVRRMHTCLRATRGAAVAVTEVLWGRREVRHAGVGNISARIYSGEDFRSLVSHNGTVGAEARKIEEIPYPWPEDGLLVLHTDGLATHWNLDDYPGLAGRHPALIAGVLFRDHYRERDDCAVVVLRETGDRP